VEDGLQDLRPDRTIEAMSDAYFALLTEHPALQGVFALGERVRFRHAGQVWEVR
jgi:hypothetical protein